MRSTVQTAAVTDDNVNEVDIDDEPVTVVVTRRVKAGHEASYEAWLKRFVDAAAALPGFGGARLVVPRGTREREPREYTSVFRFASVADLRAFEASPLRAQALAEVQPHVEGDAAWQRLTGLELWFSPPPGTVVLQPSRARMALVMTAVVYGLVLSLGQLVGVVFAFAPPPLRLLITITIEVFLMTYVIMPRLTRHLARFIYPR